MDVQQPILIRVKTMRDIVLLHENESPIPQDTAVQDQIIGHPSRSDLLFFRMPVTRLKHNIFS